MSDILLNWLLHLKGDWRLRRGLIVAPVLFFVTCIVCVKAEIRDYKLWVAGGGTALYVLVWLCARYIPPLWGRRYCVAICLRSDERSASTVAKIVRQLRVRLDQYDTHQRIRIKVLPGDLIRDAKGAEAYSRWTGIPVVVWGSYERETRGGAEIDLAPSIYFETRFVARVIDTKTMNGYVRSLQDVIRPVMSAGIRLTETSIDIPREAHGYVQTIVGLLAPVLLEAGDPLACADLAESLLRQMQEGDALRPYLRTLVMFAIECHLQWCGHVSHQERTALLERAWQFPEGKHYQLAMNIARSAWDVGDRSKAESFTEEIERLAPGLSCYAFNKAFLSLYNRQYNTSAKWYKKAFGRYRTREDAMNLSEIVDFLGEQKRLHSDEIGYDFAIGVANCAGFDESLGITDLTRFCEDAAHRPEYAGMVSSAQEIISPMAGGSKQIVTRQSRPRGRKTGKRRRR